MGNDGTLPGGTLIDLKCSFNAAELPKQTNHPGEDIRAAKAIFEDRFGESYKTDVRLWMEYAREVGEYLGIKGIQETAKHLNVKPRRFYD